MRNIEKRLEDLERAAIGNHDREPYSDEDRRFHDAILWDPKGLSVLHRQLEERAFRPKDPPSDFMREALQNDRAAAWGTLLASEREDIWERFQLETDTQAEALMDRVSLAIEQGTEIHEGPGLRPMATVHELLAIDPETVRLTDALAERRSEELRVRERLGGSVGLPPKKEIGDAR
jgi:hypothetical protein